MRNPNGQVACLKGENHPNPSMDFKPLNSSEVEFMHKIKFQGIDELIDSLKMVHDFALYHTDLSLDTTEKMALFNLKILWESLEKLVKC
ncbi:hypothetical protein JMN32_15305 [Fulvivirga sp. 29W222]|uniref:Uncharacterized protein n=1 Tax=Fulvivirga marina TaxID=2494733 RepID=A0A937FX37_9BACT|nr:hypothetical protein [Fulvivirga marina]MBL6447684.1 hypothetical protein [Fulvivirga marina]